jgi:hypothetical protein
MLPCFFTAIPLIVFLSENIDGAKDLHIKKIMLRLCYNAIFKFEKKALNWRC